MQLRHLRQVLQQIVVAGLPLAASGCFLTTDDDDEADHGCDSAWQDQWTVKPPVEASLQFTIDQCRVDASQCADVCVALDEEEQSYLSRCDVVFVRDETRVTGHYSNRGCDAGRRPAGLVATLPAAARSAAGAWLAQAAWLEAASIHAFVQLARELAAHGAPAALVAAAVRGAEDEVRHARVMTRLAARYGARPMPVEVAPPAPRSLEAIALENATEGCVRETWGAVVAAWQAATALDPELRDAFRTIARDESRHAALAWQIDAWLRPQLDAAAQARIDAARAATAAAVVAEHTALPAFAGAGALGLPVAAAARDLAARSHAALWT